jgi:hypothetical protein
MPGYLTRDRILELFKRLNKKLQAREQTADLYIVGGAVMALAHDAKRVTEDVDSHIRNGRDAVKRAVREIAAEERDLSPEWLNEAVTMRHLPEGPDEGESAMYTDTHLQVNGASVERMIAMKLHAGRDADLDDLDTLLPAAAIDSRQSAVATHGRTYGTRPMAPEADQYLIDRYVRRRTTPAAVPARPTISRPTPPGGEKPGRSR